MKSPDNTAGLSTMSSGMREARNYYDWLFRVIGPMLGRNVLEIGPGWGQMLEHVSASGRGYWAVDNDPEVIHRLKANHPTHATRLAHGDITEPVTADKFQKNGIDTILMMNILEHVEQDAEFLASVKKHFPGTTVVIQVPALPSLYGKMDKEAGHYRRYTRASLRETMNRAGFSTNECFYFNFVGALTWFAASRLARTSLRSSSTGAMISVNDKFIIPLSPPFEPLTRKLLGQSVIAVGA